MVGKKKRWETGEWWGAKTEISDGLSVVCYCPCCLSGTSRGCCLSFSLLGFGGRGITQTFSLVELKTPAHNGTPSFFPQLIVPNCPPLSVQFTFCIHFARFHDAKQKEWTIIPARFWFELPIFLGSLPHHLRLTLPPNSIWISLIEHRRGSHLDDSGLGSFKIVMKSFYKCYRISWMNDTDKKKKI